MKIPIEARRKTAADAEIKFFGS